MDSGRGQKKLGSQVKILGTLFALPERGAKHPEGRSRGEGWYSSGLREENPRVTRALHCQRVGLLVADVA